MKEIKDVAIIGRGAIGITFGTFIYDHLGDDHFYYIVDEQRKEKYERQDVLFNDKPYHFQYRTDLSPKPADLIILAVKYTAIDQAIKEIRPFVKKETIIISTLNGIKSEKDLRKAFGKDKVVRCIAQKMGAVYKDNVVVAIPVGELVIGAESAADEENVNSLVHFFNQCHLPFVLSDDIIHDAWSKLMLNCGINQTCALYKLKYKDVQHPGKYRNIMIKTMREVQDLADAIGIELTERDFNFWMKAIDRLGPDGMPSMAQDVMNGKKTEIDLFAGTVVPLAKEQDMDVPYNEYFLKKIKELESHFK